MQKLNVMLTPLILDPFDSLIPVMGAFQEAGRER